MKTPTSLTLFIALLFSCTVSAQNFTITKGPEQTEKSKFVPREYLGSDDNFIYVQNFGKFMNEMGAQYSITKVDKKTLVATPLITLEGRSYDCDEEVFLKGDKIYDFYNIRKDATRTYYLRVINTSTGKVDKEEILLDKFPLRTEEFNQEVSFGYSFSENNSKLAVFSKVTQFKKPNNVFSINVDIYDLASFKKIESKPIPNPCSDPTMDLWANSLFVDDQGTIFYSFNFTNVNSGARGIEWADFFDTYVGFIPPNSKSINPVSIKRAGKKLKYNRAALVNGKLVFAGLWMDSLSRVEKNPTGGTFFYLIDPKTGKIEKETYDNIPEAAKIDLAYKSLGSKNNAIDKEYRVIDVLYKNNSYYFVFENRFSMGSSLAKERLSGNMFGSGIGDVTREIVVAKYSGTLALEWMSVIPRWSMTGAAPKGYVNGCNYLFLKDKLAFLYIERDKNIEACPNINACSQSEMQQTLSITGVILVYVTVDEKGKLERNQVFTNDDWYYLRIGNKTVSTEKENGFLLYMQGDGRRFDALNIK